MYNRKLHPVTKKPLESYRMTFLDLGRRDGEANIVKVVRKDREFVTWTTGGAVLPSGYGKSINTLRSNGKGRLYRLLPGRNGYHVERSKSLW